MLSKPLMLLHRALRTLWVRVLLMMMLALLAAVVAPFFDPVLPDALKDRIDRDAVLPILTILASSMLAVTTFSLGVMVQAFQAASSQATPRAYRVLMQDTTTQTVLATFVGAFLFALLGVVMFRAEFYGPSAVVVVFGLTLVVITLIVLAILRWIDHLTQLGSMDFTLEMVSAAALQALRAATRAPALGAVPVTHDTAAPMGSQPVLAARSGYVQFINVDWLQDQMEAAESHLWITAAPGDHVLQGTPIARVSGAVPKDLAGAFTIANIRTMEQDARYGLVVLSEIAARALSPGINDPGTAIDAIRRMERILWNAAEAAEPAKPKFDRLHAHPLSADQLLRDAYGVVIRDGAARVEVMRQLAHALDKLRESGAQDMQDAARATQRYMASHVNKAMAVEVDRDAFAELLSDTREGG